MDNQAAAPITMALIDVQLTASGAATTVGSTGTVHYAIRGKAYTAAALSSTATPTTDWATGSAFTALAKNKGTVFLFGLDSGGTLRVIQGTVVDLDGIVSSNKFLVAPQFGGLGPSGSGTTDNDFCPIAYITVANGTTGSNWTFGTSNWNATGITLAIQNVVGMPDRPQIA